MKQLVLSPGSSKAFVNAVISSLLKAQSLGGVIYVSWLTKELFSCSFIYIPLKTNKQTSNSDSIVSSCMFWALFCPWLCLLVVYKSKWYNSRVSLFGGLSLNTKPNNMLKKGLVHIPPKWHCIDQEKYM